MQFSPTITLALALAAGIAGAAAAQTATTATPSTTNPSGAAANAQTGWQPGQSHPGVAQSPGAYERTPQAYGQPQAQTAPGRTSPNAMAQPNQANQQGQPAAAQAQNEVRQAQEQLRAAGLYNGPTDGMMDPDTRAAIERFQVQNGLQRTGNLDQQTAARLMRAPAPSSGTSTPAPAATQTGAPAPSAGGGLSTGHQQPLNR